MKLLVILVLFAIAIASCTADRMENKGDRRLDKRNIINDVAQRFVLPQIAYQFAPAAAATASNPVVTEMIPARQRLVHRAMRFLSDKTCLEFFRSTTVPTGSRRIMFAQATASPICCTSRIGAAVSTDNFVFLTDGCGNLVPLIARYIMHALGFHAMSARSDATTYLTTTVANINATITAAVPTSIKGFPPIITVPQAAAVFGTLPPFEFGSILAYSPAEFSDRTKPVFTATTAHSNFQSSMGTGRFTFLDFKMINDAFCATSCTGVTTICHNSGYPDPTNCDQCICPEGFSGNDCSQLPSGSVANNTQGIIFNSTNAWQRTFITFGQSPNVGIRSEFMNRVDWIMAPAGRTIEARVHYMFLQCNPGCKTAGVELKSSRSMAGVRICCQNLINVTISSTVSPMPVLSYNRWASTSFHLEYRHGIV